MKTVNAVGQTTVTDKTGATLEKKHDLGPVPVDGAAHAEVTVEMSFTKNLGNYQSARMAVMLKLPANTDVASLETAFEYAKNWVDTKLTSMVEEADKTLG